MNHFPDIEIPDFISLSKRSSWDPRRYQPVVFDDKIKYYSENLKPGTLAYDDFWDEMDYYCYNGFQPKGMPRITGRHFYYLNFNKIDMMVNPRDKRKRLGSPLYRDLDHMMFLELEGAIKYGYGLVVAKPRRIGLSEFGALNTNYELTFFSRTKVGICAGKEDKAQEFYEKLISSLNNVHPAYRSGKIKSNSELLKLGYEDYINKQKVECGLQSLARIKTMYADSGAFEGGSYSMVIFEEAGLFENLTASYKATEPCFKEGHTQFGVPLIYGTGGEIDKGAKGYKQMWDKYEAYNVKPIFVPAYYYYPGDGIPDEKTGKIVSFFDRKKGVTDRELAKKYIEKDRIRASKAKETYVKHIQSYPLHPKEVFLKTKGGILDRIKLNFQLKKITAGEEEEPVLQGRLDWVDEPRTTLLLERATTLKEKTKIRLANNSKVKFVVDENGTVWKDAKPINPNVKHMNYKPDIGACDSYDEEVDEENTTVSSGCVMAYRLFSGPTRLANKPVGVLYERGDASFDNDVFYENAVKFAVYWDMEILFEYTKFHIMRYFYDVGAHQYVRARPMLESTGSINHKNKDGMKMTVQAKREVTKMLKIEVKENIHKCFFMNIILDLLNYGDENTDIADTYGLVLCHKLDLFGEVSEDIEMDHSGTTHNDMSTLDHYYVDVDGTLKISSFQEKNRNEILVFNPERDLDEKSYNEYVEQMESKEKKLKEQQKAFEEQHKQKGLDESIMDLIISEQKKYQ